MKFTQLCLEKRLEPHKTKLSKLHQDNGTLKQQEVALKFQMQEEQQKCKKQEKELSDLKDLEETEKNEEKNLLAEIKKLTSTKNSLGTEVTAMKNRLIKLKQH